MYLIVNPKPSMIHLFKYQLKYIFVVFLINRAETELQNLAASHSDFELQIEGYACMHACMFD